MNKKAYLKVVLFGLTIRLIYLAIEMFFAPDHHALFIAPDSPHYINLANSGYGITENDEHLFIVFFPLFPMLLRTMHLIIPDYTTAGYVISLISFCIGLCYLYNLVILEHAEKAAWWTIILVSVAPFSFFFGTVMTESLFLMLTVMTLYYIKKHNWLIVGLIGAFACFSRMVGIVLAFTSLIEFLIYNKNRYNVKRFVIDGLCVAIMGIGAAAYLYMNWKYTGDMFKFLYYQRTHWYHISQPIWETVIEQFKSAFFSNYDLDIKFYNHILNLISLFFVLGVTIYAVFNKKNTTYVAYALSFTVLSYSASWLISGGRYLLTCAPVYLFLAQIINEKKWRGIAISTVSFVFSIALFYQFLNGAPIF